MKFPYLVLALAALLPACSRTPSKPPAPVDGKVRGARWFVTELFRAQLQPPPPALGREAGAHRPARGCPEAA